MRLPLRKLGLAILVATGLAASPAAVLAQGASMTIANPVSPVSYDPLRSNAGHALQYLWPIYDSLLHIGDDGKLVPGLAEKWEYNEGNTVLTITLRAGLKFADGTPLDAEAARLNFERAQQVNGPQKGSFSAVQTIEVVDPLTIRLNLAAPAPALTTSLSQNLGMMVSPAAINNPDLDQKPSGAGGYTLDTANTVADDHYTYVKNPNYYDPDAYHFDTVTIRVIADLTSQLQSLQAGQVDAGKGNITTADAAKAAGLSVHTGPTDTAGLLLFDRTGKFVPALGDVRVRQALNYAIDRQAIVDTIVRGYGTPTSQFYSEGMEGYDPELVNFYPYDPEKAKALLAEAGYADGFTFPILTGPNDVTIVEAISGYLAAVGVTAEIQPPSQGGDLFGDVVAGGHPAAYVPWGMSNTYFDTFNLVGKGGFGNPEGYTDDEMIALLEQGAGQPDAERNETYKKLSHRLTEQAWFLPLFIADAVYITNDKIKDVKLTPHVIVPLWRGWAPAN